MIKKDGDNENWADVTIRHINGIFSIRKDFYIKNHIHWDESWWQDYASKMAIAAFEMKWLPPGRGLWSCGTDFVYERGSMSLNNCSACKIDDDIGFCVEWIMDALMLGVGVGFEPIRNDDFKLHNPRGFYDYVIPDTREGWAKSEQALIDAYTKPKQKEPRFIYDELREAGSLIKGFGGVASGPDPLKILHDQTRHFLIRYMQEKDYDSVRLKADIVNCVGCCVISGNVRRSAELCLGHLNDQTFINLKDYNVFPDRAAYGFMSNNTCKLQTDEDFENLDIAAVRLVKNGEPGLANLRNFRFGRIGKYDDIVKLDKADLLNPCSEILLENFELCNLSQWYPSRCKNPEEYKLAQEYATLYASTVSLLPTHKAVTNKVIARNRRIGVSVAGVIEWKKEFGVNKVIKWLRQAYHNIRRVNTWCAEEAGVPESIRVTTNVPGGTVTKIVGEYPAMYHPTFKYMIRRIRVPQYSPMYFTLDKAGIPHEPDFYSANTEVFEYPVGPNDLRVKTEEEVSLWEQANDLILMQREYSDNSVSNTLKFKPKWILKHHLTDPTEIQSYIEWVQELPEVKIVDGLYENIHVKIVVRESEVKEYHYNPHHEENDVEPVLSSTVPMIKTMSMMPHTPKGVYKQMPEEGITKEEYLKRKAAINKIDWSKYKGSSGEGEHYCVGDKCELPVKY